MFEHTRIIAALSLRETEGLSPNEREQLQEHLQHCAECREQEARFLRSLHGLRSACREIIPPNVSAAVLARMDQPKARWISWRTSWVGAAAMMSAVLAVSLMLARPNMDKQQILQAYGDDIQTLWEGGGADSTSTWMQYAWSENTWLEQVSTTQAE